MKQVNPFDSEFVNYSNNLPYNNLLILNFHKSFEQVTKNPRSFVARSEHRGFESDMMPFLKVI